jgi:type I restriction enzyme M protein
MVHKPEWFQDGFVFVSYADTVGINKDGNTLYRVDPSTGKRTEIVDNKVEADVDALLETREGSTSRWISSDNYTVGVPAYYSDEYSAPLRDLLAKPAYTEFKARTLGDLIADRQIDARAGHGSPSADLRDGAIPYIKVSDIRAGQININPTNMVPRVVAALLAHS